MSWFWDRSSTLPRTTNPKLGLRPRKHRHIRQWIKCHRPLIDYKAFLGLK